MKYCNILLLTVIMLLGIRAQAQVTVMVIFCHQNEVLTVDGHCYHDDTAQLPLEQQSWVVLNINYDFFKDIYWHSTDPIQINDSFNEMTTIRNEMLRRDLEQFKQNTFYITDNIENIDSQLKYDRCKYHMSKMGHWYKFWHYGFLDPCKNLITRQ